MSNPLHDALDPGDARLPSPDYLTQYAQNRIQLNPEKFGLVGAFSREMLMADVSMEPATDSLLMRLMTTVMCGSSVSEEPEVVLHYPATPWQHLKRSVFNWRLKFGFRERSKLMTAWLWIVARTLFWVLDKYSLKRPVKWTDVTAKIHFDQRVMYPEFDQMPAAFGRPVIYETISMSYPDVMPEFGSNLRSDPSRFLDRHEIARKVYEDSASVGTNYPYNEPWSPHATLHWLERHGVNVDQLVKRH